jgi:predicted DNA-binding helix-hairpin-helix protein
MEVLEKAKILGKAGHYDSCGPKMCEVNVNSGLGEIYYAKAEHKSCRIFKTLMDNNCSFDCKYCQNSNKCAKKKVSYEPEELAKVFDYLRKNLQVNGLFLSSAVAGNPDKVTEKMIEAVKIIRYKQNFHGYVHFKVLPGTSYEMVKQAAELSDRMSINIEAPNKEVLSELSTCKDYHNDLLKRQAWVSKMNLSGGQSTQMIINDMSTDKDVLKMTNWEYESLDLHRVYYSAFHPVKGTPLENAKPESLTRQNRLYNVDFLMREYDYKIKEFDAIMEDEMLPQEDPKLALAKANFDSPVDINEASYEELIRVPGIGPKTAKKIVNKKEKITKYEQLNYLGGWIERAKPFIEIAGKRQTSLLQF